MADVKISDLPAAASAASGNELETNQSGTSRRITILQILNALAPNIALGADGSASFVNGVASFDVLGNSTFGSGNCVIQPGGAVSLAGGAITLNTDGSALFDNGGIAFVLGGTATFVGGDFAINAGGGVSFGGGDGSLGADGSATFGSGTTVINGDGSSSFAVAAASPVNISSSGDIGFAGATAAGNFNADGSVSLCGGSVTITPSGDVEITDTTKGVILTAADTSRWRIKVDAAGVLSTEAA